LPPKILIVEDSPTMRSLIVSALEEGGVYDIYESPNGFEALKMLPHTRFDLILTDINMPDINGLELVSFVRSQERYREIPLIIISTEGSTRDRDKGMKLGANEYLVKPFNPEHLQELVKKYLTGKQE
jgi:two-component system, chemotaxis family, chemotaxis protein CheY